MDIETLSKVYQLLEKAGYQFPKVCPDGFLCIIDPACIWPPLLEFINTAWIIITLITGFLLAGWGITMVRGANHNMIKNLRDLVLIFGVLSAALPIVNVLGGGKAIVNQCNTIKIPFSKIQSILEEHAGKQFEHSNYETLEIQDSGAYTMDNFQNVSFDSGLDF